MLKKTKKKNEFFKVQFFWNSIRRDVEKSLPTKLHLWIGRQRLFKVINDFVHEKKMSVKAIYRGRDKNKSRDIKLVHLAKVKNLSSLSAWVISKRDVRFFLAKHQRDS